MTSVLKDIRKIKNGEYTIEDLEKYFEVANVGLLYSVTFEVTKNKIINDKILSCLADLAYGKLEVSNRGVAQKKRITHRHRPNV